jgi:hypothetical protein
MTEMDTKAIIEARKKAEAAVEEMPEGELRVEAFKLILNRLLSGGEGSEPTRESRQATRRHASAHESKAAENQAEDFVPRSATERILALKAERFFEKERGIGEVREELQTHGWRYDVTALSGTLMGLVQRRELRRSKVVNGKKTTYKYFNP